MSAKRQSRHKDWKKQRDRVLTPDKSEAEILKQLET